MVRQRARDWRGLVVCGMERRVGGDGRSRRPVVEWDKPPERSGAPESPTPTAFETPLPYRSNRHGRWGCAQRKKNKRQVYTELLLLATAFKAKYDYFCHGRRHHTMGIIKYKRAKNGNDEIVNIVY
jgi:hypothetical protein